jgi:hypothetical protein
MPKSGWKALVLVVLLVIFAVIDFFPHFGAPNFRYTGADPEIHVWNFGWPLATFIYDSRSGFHVGPIAATVLVCQFIVLGIAAFVLRAKNRGKTEQSD